MEFYFIGKRQDLAVIHKNRLCLFLANHRGINVAGAEVIQLFSQFIPSIFRPLVCLFVVRIPVSIEDLSSSRTMVREKQPS